MRYPNGFPPKSQASVTLERLRAGKDFDEALQSQKDGFDLRAELRRYILRQFAAFVREACKFGCEGAWPVAYVEEASLEFLRLATIDAKYSRGRNRNGTELTRNWISSWTGSIEDELQHEFEKSDEWRQFQDMLIQLAEGSEARVSNAEGKAPTEPDLKHGYRAEVRAWMKREDLRSVNQAASRLGISLSALKSIMSDRGKRRYSNETLIRILGEIGYKRE